MTRERGQSFIESALVLAAFMTLLLGMVTISGSLYLKQTLAARAHEAARWGALNPGDSRAIRNLVLYGSATPASGASPLLGLSVDAVVVTAPGCPGAGCRITVAIPEQGIQSSEPVEALNDQPQVDTARPATKSSGGSEGQLLDSSADKGR